MLSIHAVQDHPQWISTERHVMRGYVGLVEMPIWDAARRTLSGVSAVVGGEPYRAILALNGAAPVGAEVERATAAISVRQRNPGLADLVIEDGKNQTVDCSVRFAKDLSDSGDHRGYR